MTFAKGVIGTLTVSGLDWRRWLIEKRGRQTRLAFPRAFADVTVRAP